MKLGPLSKLVALASLASIASLTAVGGTAAGAVGGTAVGGAATRSALAPVRGEPACPQQGADPARPECGRYIVVLKESVGDPAAVARDHGRYGAEVHFVYRSALKGYAATLPPVAVDAVRADPRVAFVEGDRLVEALEQETPSLGQETPSGVARVFADDNAKVGIDGSDDARIDVDIAVLDTGIDREHPDLNVVGRADCTLADAAHRRFPRATKPMQCLEDAGRDGNGHGTHVAGTAAAIDNGIGVVGVAPGARLWGVKVLDDSGSGFESWVLAGVDWVTANAGTIDVANMSLGFQCAPPFCESDAIDEAISKSVASGVVYVVAAGNEQMDAKDYVPANHPDVITVSALADFDGEPDGRGAPTCPRDDEDDTLANFSNFGAAVEVAAPGVCILSTWKGGGYETLSGTSMASPAVAGAAALLVASSGSVVDKDDVEAIRQTIVDSGNYDWQDVTPPRCEWGINGYECSPGGAPDGIHEPLLDVHNSGVFAPGTDTGVFTSRPIAKFTLKCSDEMRCDFDGSNSYDRDGTIARYSWHFGDRSTAAGATVSHSYRRAGAYVVTLTVTDDRGATSREAAYVYVSDGKIGPHLAEPRCGRPGDTKCEKWVAAYDNANGFGSGGSDFAFAAAASPRGDRVYVTGTSWDNGTQSADIATVAYDGATGKQLWVARHAGREGVSDFGYDVVVSPDGSRVSVTGLQNFNFFDAAGECADGGPICSDVATITYDAATGRQLWTADYSPSPDSCAGEWNYFCALVAAGNELAVSADGGRLYVTGSTVVPCRPGEFAHQCDAYLTIAYDAATGRELWLSRYEDFGGHHSANSIAASPDGSRVYVTGSAEGEGFGCGHCGTDAVTVAYDAGTGTEVWHARQHTSDLDRGADVRVTRDGSRVYIGGDAQIGFSRTGDIVVAAYDAVTGQQSWAAQYDGGDRLTGFDVSGTGDRVYATGYRYDSEVAGAGPNFDAVTVAYDAVSGQRVWAEAYRGSGGGSWEFGSGVVAAPDGSRVYVTGFTIAPYAAYGTPNFYIDYVTIGYRAIDGAEAWVARYNSSPTGNDEDIVTPLGYGGGPAALSADGSRLFVTGYFSEPGNVANCCRYGTVAYDTRHRR